MTIPSDALTALTEVVGPGGLRSGEAIPARNRKDASKAEEGLPALLVLPRNTEEVAAVLAICSRFSLPVVVQGGMTGLAGGAAPLAGEVALSLERMSGVEEIDPVTRTMTVLAGTPLMVVQEKAAEAGFLYGVDLGARGSCTIGGNVATNAGGVQVLRYGMTRRNVLGLEAVMADGRVVSHLKKVVKNNAGYDWTQLFIGSEGTLGVVTRVLLALQPAVTGVQTALCAAGSVDKALATLNRLEARLGGNLLAFEAMWPEYMKAATGQGGLPSPFATQPELTLVIEAAMGTAAASEDAFAEALAELAEEGLLDDALIAQSSRDRQRFWAYREANYEFYRDLPPGIHFDVSIPLGAMETAVTLLRQRVEARSRAAFPIVFGHLADSNLHLSVHDAAMELSGFADIVYELVREMQGSISAEHGVGILKRPYLGMSRSDAELALMTTLKRTLDPANILNRGRILPA
ncbi:FAD-binding oxidoreductase [Bosea sp. CER48]|uniref:FAD-binding oxidoreductase n=1 Tax=Bosea sp. CER48 TaxID=3377035 RepID=UPI003800895A